MPSFENVSYNSSRVQRAYRINNIEQIRLQGRLNLLDKERIHRQRLTNQDIRLISLTLDYIRTCSGHSAEGLSPDAVSVDDEDEIRKDNGPCFLYGERIVSRKAKRRSTSVRPQSALDQSVGSRVDSDAASVVSSAQTSFRPQSSPIRRKPTFITTLNKEDEGDCMSTSGESHSDIWDDEPSEITKILLRAQENNGSRRESVFTRDRNSIRSSAAVKALTRNLRQTSGKLTESQISIQSRSRSSIGERGGPSQPPRSAKITDLINQGRATMSASAWKANLASNSALPMTSALQSRMVMDNKKSLNRSRTEIVEEKVKRFIKR